MLRTAIKLVDDGGIESLTMRKLGQALGVEAMSLYNHVENKDDIVAGILDLVASEFEPPSADEGWKASIRKSAVGAHDALRRHPWACGPLMAPRLVPARLRYMESLLGCLREAGFSAELTYHAYHALDAHIFGFSLWQAGHSMPSGVDLRGLAASFLHDLRAQNHPHLAEHVEQHIAEGPHQDVSAFAFSLDLILDGLERAHAAELRETRGGRKRAKPSY